MNNEAKNFSKLLYFTESLCAFADYVAKHHECEFNIQIDDDKFKFDLPELVIEVRKYHQAVIDDIENFNNKHSVDEHESIFDEPFVSDFTIKKTSSDEITMSDFDYFRQGMPDTVKKLFDLLLPLSIIEEENRYKKLSEPKPKHERVKAIEMHTMLRMALMAVS